MPLHRMYDSAPHIFPPTATTVALYVNGLYRFDPERVRSEWETVLWIDVLGTAPGQASILDIETGDVPPGDTTAIRRWCEARVSGVPDTLLRLYSNLSAWPAVKHAVAGLPAGVRLTAGGAPRVRYWIANPTGAEHIVPGSAATQWKWGKRWDTSSYTGAW